MTEQEIRKLVAQVLVLRNTEQFKEEEAELLGSGAVLNSQVGRANVRERAAELRALAPEPILLQTDMETGSYFAAGGVQVPPQMAVGAADSEELAREWGYQVGLEGRRLGVDVVWSPVLDVNTNPDNPIINVRAFSEDAAVVGRLGAAMTRGFLASGMHPAGKHWPGHGDVAVDSHIALPTLDASRERLESVDWPPYVACREAGLESVMTAHLLVPSVDPDNCATVSKTLITGILRERLGYQGCLWTDSLAMEGLRLTMDSAQAAWMALVAGHDQIVIDYKRSPIESYREVLAACLDGRVPLERLQDAARRVLALKARRAALRPLPPEGVIRSGLECMSRRVAAQSVTLSGSLPVGGPALGAKPLLVILDDLKKYGVGMADEQEGGGLKGTHPLAAIWQAKTGGEVVLASETPAAEDLARVEAAAAGTSAIIGATFAHIQCYKGEGVRLPELQAKLWQRLWAGGKLVAMMLFESPYALGDLPAEVPVIIGYGGDKFTLEAVSAALLAGRPCPGKLPVTVARG
jgi:beta-N-acetylhexosaminidase